MFILNIHFVIKFFQKRCIICTLFMHLSVSASLGGCMCVYSTAGSISWFFPRLHLKRPDFHEGKSAESKCNKTVVHHITQISSWIPHSYHDNIRVQIVRNYIIYYIAALAESKVALIQKQLEDKIVKLERRHEPLNRQTPRSYTPQQNLCAKIYQYDLYWPLPTLWALLCESWMQVGYKQSKPIRLGFPMH